jgi:hypothetical protein
MCTRMPDDTHLQHPYFTNPCLRAHCEVCVSASSRIFSPKPTAMSEASHVPMEIHRLPHRSGLLAAPRRLHARRALQACQSCRSSDAVLASQTALHNGTTRTVWQLDTTAWLDGNVELDKLPPRYNVITSVLVRMHACVLAHPFVSS